MQFTVGDVVILKSGGPSMTVRAISKEGKLFCCWFNQDTRTYEYQQADFPPEAVRKVQ